MRVVCVVDWFGLMLVCCFSCVWFGGGFGVLLVVAASWVGCAFRSWWI